ncbi:hypothetical protein BC938DRAFT_471233 [Jimgerdemannia flammicorona]|uniref:Uncharacterized protein n=1 Tax=Jimgerdemannia flammicorona TaxID=994334 RepID=A0A433Q8M7_9FUNG|nr:hypothetical protein BC938DRAFT_471233 [Jimgerdemannia flammicorona]
MFINLLYARQRGQFPQYFHLDIDRQRFEHLGESFHDGILIILSYRQDLLGEGIMFQAVDALVDVLALALEPLSNNDVVGLPVAAVDVAGHALARQLGVSSGQAAERVLLAETSPHTPVEEAAGEAPFERLLDRALGLHAAGGIVQVRKLERDLRVHGKEVLLARRKLYLDVLLLLRGLTGVVQQLLEIALCLAELDLDDTLGFEDTGPSLDISVHLHHVAVDGRVHHDPRATTQLTVGNDIHENGLLVVGQRVDDVRTVLENFVEHVALTTGEATPVGEDDQRQLLALVEVVDGLSSLEGRIGVPHLTGFHQHLLMRVGVGGIGRDNVLDGPGLDSNAAHGDTTETCTTNNLIPIEYTEY